MDFFSLNNFKYSSPPRKVWKLDKAKENILNKKPHIIWTSVEKYASQMQD